MKYVCSKVKKVSFQAQHFGSVANLFFVGNCGYREAAAFELDLHNPTAFPWIHTARKFEKKVDKSNIYLGKIHLLWKKLFTVEVKNFTVKGKNFTVKGKLFTDEGKLFTVEGKRVSIEVIFTIEGRKNLIKGLFFSVYSFSIWETTAALLKSSLTCETKFHKIMVLWMAYRHPG